MIMVAIVKAITVMVRFAVSHPVMTSVTATTEGLILPASHADAVEAALRMGRSKSATRIAAADAPAHVGSSAATAKTPAHVGSAAASEAATTAKTTAVADPAASEAAATAVAAPAASTGKTVGNSKSCEKNSDRSRCYYLIARH